MRLLYSILISITAFSACAKTNMDNSVPVTSINSNAPTNDSLSYLALGDSYTIGESVPQIQSYPYQLVTALDEKNYGFKSPVIIARTGWTTDALIDAIASSNITKRNFDIVTLLIGVNDQFQGLSQDNYRTKFIAVLDTAIAFANHKKSRVFVLSIPDYGVTPFAKGDDSKIGPEIDQFNAINREESEKAGVNYVDITAISRQAAANPALIAGDGLHPSGVMYNMWINLLLPSVVKYLQ